MSPLGSGGDGGARHLAAGRATAAGASGGSLAPDAAMALGIAATAMPFTRTRQAAVEHWLRVLRLHGQAGAALRSLGVGEERVQPAAAAAAAAAARIEPGAQDKRTVDGGDPVSAVAERARRIARRRSEAAITTADLLLAVIDLYGNDCDRVLRLHGTDRAELLQRLGREAASVGPGGGVIGRPHRGPDPPTRPA